MRIVIIGAGIAGLTTALSLKAAGFDPVVFEAARSLEPLGVGLNVLPHAVREFAGLGCLEDIRRIGVEIDELQYRTRHGALVWREPRGRAAGYPYPQVAVHRGRLQMTLLDLVRRRLGQDAVRFGQRLVGLESRGDGATLAFADRSGGARVSLEADLAIGADGIHSAVRQSFYPDEGPPIWNGVMLWRGAAPTGRLLGGRSMLWAGWSAQKFVAYPIAYDPESGETLLNFICDLRVPPGETPAREDWNRVADPARFLPRFADWRWDGVDVPDLVGRAERIFEFPMVDRDPLPRWTFGRATLVGDAAHAMYPIGSNGATQGVIDARALAFHLVRNPDPDRALAAYEAERRPATSRIVEMNRRNGPDQVLELAHARAPDPGDDLDARLPMAERAEIADAYKRVAGFDPAAFAAHSPYALPGEAPG